jgi:hypothetical protein
MGENIILADMHVSHDAARMRSAYSATNMDHAYVAVVNTDGLNSFDTT